ncbi:GFA family protein [Teredinibacter turnerae]|uniref:GFA family protein n=1 Tax=Teredinibacter turnerae TaxID=2426 RepID=UPI0009B7D3F1|nr:GFA family protein [Teredinibacter turnerae]
MLTGPSCSCGELQVEVSGEPKIVVACSCTICQKRTGSVFGVSAYFSNDQLLAKNGEFKSFTSTGDSGGKIERHFCPRCGSTVFWEARFVPQSIGIAVGCFSDPQFPLPIAAAWCASKHEWVSFPNGIPTSNNQDFSSGA